MSKSVETITRELSCPHCESRTFEIRINGEEGIGLAHCLACRNDFLLLDSEDYWFDLIQQAYPRVRRCACSSTSFELACTYTLRDDGDVSKACIHSSCAACGKARKQLNIAIDYSPTDDLIHRPLRYCAQPKLIYDLHEFSLFLKPSDMVSIVSYLHEQHQWVFMAQRWLDEHREWQQLPLGEVEELVLENRFLSLYAGPSLATHHAPSDMTAREENALWKRLEVVRINSPIGYGYHGEQGLLYYINFANEFVADEQIMAKSAAFKEATAALRKWLQTHFVSWRGKNQFDNIDENRRLFGDHFQP